MKGKVAKTSSASLDTTIDLTGSSKSPDTSIDLTGELDVFDPSFDLNLAADASILSLPGAMGFSRSRPIDLIPSVASVSIAQPVDLMDPAALPPSDKRFAVPRTSC